jgi:pimeloyl-ACP methyl ester carboxylesterase
MVRIVPEGNDVYIMGLSWGGVVAAHYASRFPDAVKRLILASFIPKSNNRLRAIIHQGRFMAANGQAGSIPELILTGFGRGLPLYFRHLMNRQFGSINDISLRALEQYAAWLETIQNVTDFIDFSSIKAKTLMVIGENDIIIDLSDLRETASLIPQNEFMVVKNAGHFLHLEDSSIFEVYARFFDTKPAKSYKRYLGAYFFGRGAHQK